MNAAVQVILGIGLIAFGSWRLLAGLYLLDLIDWRVPGYDQPQRFLPRVMRSPRAVQGLAATTIGVVFMAGGVLAVVWAA